MRSDGRHSSDGCFGRVFRLSAERKLRNADPDEYTDSHCYRYCHGNGNSYDDGHRNTDAERDSFTNAAASFSSGL